MKNLVLSAVAIVLLASSSVSAQQYDRRDRDSNYRDHDARAQRWSTGDRLPREYRQDRYVYSDWRDSGLRRPPRGHQWMMINDQYVLARRDGMIVEVVMVAPRRREPDYGRERADNGGDREDKWRQRYHQTYTYNDDVAYTECRNQPDPAGVLAGAFLGAILGNAAGGRGDRTGATVAGVIAGGAVGAALTSKLDCSDRSYAYQTYSQGFNGGRGGNASYEWRNPQNNHRGEMRVLDYYNDEDNFRCAVFSQTVYIDGRREEARGRACQQPDGKWAIID